MEDTPAEAPFLSNIGFMLTYRCTIACPHCIVEAGPHRKEEMPIDRAIDWILQSSAYRDGIIRGLALTGGEPFYNLENLRKISTYGASLGLIVSAVTNAYWASSKEAALETLLKVPSIQMISVSTDVYHQRAIPFDFICNAIWAAKELGRLYNIAVCTENEADPRFLKIVRELTAIGESENIRASITFPVGRARRSAYKFNYDSVTEPTVSACSMAGSPVIFPDGKVNACIGPLLTLPATHPLYLGNLLEESLAEILDRAELNPILHTIRVWGPHKLVSTLREHGLERLLPKKYIANCICDACYKLLSHPETVAALSEILNEEHVRYMIAYGRIYYLNETRMAEIYKFPESPLPT